MSRNSLSSALARPVLRIGPQERERHVPLNHPRIWWYLHDFGSVLARLADAGALDGRRSVTESARVGDRDLPRRQTLKRVHDVVPRLQTTGRAARRAQHLVRRPRAPRSRLRPFENLHFLHLVRVNFCRLSTAPSQPVVNGGGVGRRCVRPRGVSSNVARVSSGLGVRFARGNVTRPSSTIVGRSSARSRHLCVTKSETAPLRAGEVGTRVMYLPVTTRVPGVHNNTIVTRHMVMYPGT